MSRVPDDAAEQGRAGDLRLRHRVKAPTSIEIRSQAFLNVPFAPALCRLGPVAPAMPAKG
jgi:hypothetical protein